MLPTYETLDRITLADLEALVETSAPENDKIDYKGGDAYSENGAAKKWCKTISAFANARGGCVLLGVEEEEGCASALVGVNGDIDKLLLKLSQWAESGIRPRIMFKPKQIDIGGGKKVVVIATPASRSKPHMVVCNDDGRCFKRAASHNHPMDIDELREAVMQSDSPEQIALETHRRLIEEDIETLGHLPATVTLTFCPVPSIRDAVDPGAIELQSIGELIECFQIGLHSCRVTFDGWENEDGYDSMIRILRDGTLHSSLRGTDNPQKTGRIPHLWLARYLSECVSFGMDFQSKLADTPACFIFLTYRNVRSWSIPGAGIRKFSEITKDNLEFSAVFADGSEVDSRLLIRDWIMRLWQASGIKRSYLYDDDGMPVQSAWDKLR